jgi:hypothetical protein
VLGLGLALGLGCRVCPFFPPLVTLLILFLSRPNPDPIAEAATIPNLLTGIDDSFRRDPPSDMGRDYALDMKLFADEVFPVLDELS